MIFDQVWNGIKRARLFAADPVRLDQSPQCQNCGVDKGRPHLRTCPNHPFYAAGLF